MNTKEETDDDFQVETQSKSSNSEHEVEVQSNTEEMLLGKNDWQICNK